MTSERLRLPTDWRAWFVVAFALLLLNTSITFANVWPTPKVQWQPAVSIEVAATVLLMTVLPRRARGAAIRILPTVWLILVFGRYMDVTAPALYGRAFNLYWDAPHLGNVAAMISEAVPLWSLGAAAALAVLLILMAYLLSRAAIRWLAEALTRRALKPALLGLALFCVGAFAVQEVTGEPLSRVTFAEPVFPSYVRQARSVMAMLGPGAVTPALAAAPEAFTRPPRALPAADVYLVFVESYGAVTFDDPSFARTLTPSRAAFEQAAADTGRHIASAYVESPTFGASSWLAHLSLIAGVRVADQYSYQSLMTDGTRETLGTTLQRAGYRTIALMPGMRQAWPEGAFYRYDALYGRDDLAYEGPRFGWWSIPDQYALAKLDALEGPPGTRPPLFVVFPTSTTHAPFGPVPPYQSEWAKVLTPHPYDAQEVARILARPPDLGNLAAEYLHAMSYEFLTFAGYLRERSDDVLMILVGDHQPPAAVSGKGAPWTVPVHIITRRVEVLERLQEHGFRPGVVPSRPALGGIHEIGPLLLEALTPSE